MRISVGTYLAVVTTLVLVIISAVLGIGLASQERARAIEAKRAAGTMVTELFAASVSAEVVFQDADALEGKVRNLRRTDDVVGATVFDAEGAVIASTGDAPATPTTSTRGEAARDAVESTPVRVVVTRAIRDRNGRVIGHARVGFSLSRENRAILATRRMLVLGGIGGILTTAALLTAFARRRVVVPLTDLAEVARHMEQGNLQARAREEGTDEIATLAAAFNRMGDALAERDRRLRDELDVAADLQVSILPQRAHLRGLDIATAMHPATEVGGDYYDVIPTADGCWIGIGDVSGHGLGAGVIMLMIQAAVAALVHANPDASPVEVECTVNRVLFENIRERMHRRDHATLSLLRYGRDGTVRFAGAHEDILVYRAKTKEVEIVETAGTWVGAIEDVGKVTVESKLELADGDILVLYTDGVTEAMREGEHFGLERVAEIVRITGERGSVELVRSSICDAVFAWANEPTDDVSVVVLRHASDR
jgi:serine phosphatase RsbU (regulator of sigma subunit)/uncharacterized membrane protein affecting hemolysin expression